MKIKLYKSRKRVKNKFTYGRGRKLVITLASISMILIGIMMLQIYTNWKSFNQYTNDNNTAAIWIDGGLTNFSQDSYEMFLNLQRVQIFCMRFENKLITSDELKHQRLAASGKFFHFFPGEAIGEDFRKYETYGQSLASVTMYLNNVELFEKGKIKRAELDESYEEASGDWSVLNSEVVSKEFITRDLLKATIRAFKPLTQNTFFVVAILLILCVATLFAAVYAGWRLIQSERSQFESFELLVASIGHDLRSPLQAIQSASSLLSNKLSEKDRLHYSSIIKTSTKTLSRLVDDIIHTVKRETLSQDKRPVELSKWFNDLVNIYEAKAKSKGLKFRAAYNAPEPVYIFDPERLQQCVGNLLDNAIRYTLEGDIELNLLIEKIESIDEKSNLIIYVKDTGCGIAKVDQLRIFNPFERATTLGVRSGMGLGLSIVASFIESLNGEISLDSSPNEGSTFKIAFQIENSKLKNVQEEITEKSQRISEINQFSGNEVLLVDDDDNISASLSGQIKEAGFSVECAKNGKDGFLKLSQSPSAVVVSDIEMPLMDGFLLAEKCRTLKIRPYFIAITAHTNCLKDDPRSKLFDSILFKPVNVNALLNEIEKGISERLEVVIS